MNVIWKWEFDPRKTPLLIDVPISAQPLMLEAHNDLATLWMLCEYLDDDEDTVPVKIESVWTGVPFEKERRDMYLGTLTLYGGLVFHVFMRYLADEV